jgi:DNA-binding transcriptional LysR family regulator
MSVQSSATLDPRLLATLAAVAETASFSDAAGDLGVTQSAVSQQIAELERRLGEPVLYRRPFRLTPAGEVLLVAAERIRAALAVADQDLEALRGGEVGSITLAAFTSSTAGPVPAALARFRQDLPTVTVRLLQMEPPEAYSGILRGDVDVAVAYQYPQSPRPVPDGVEVREVGRDDFVAVVPSGHAFAERPSVSLKEVAAAGLIGTPMTNLPLPWPPGVKADAAAHGMEFAGEDYTTTLELVAQGLGVALLPALVTRRTPDGAVVVPLTGQPWHRRILLGTLAGARPTTPIQVMAGHLATALHAR